VVFAPKPDTLKPVFVNLIFNMKGVNQNSEFAKILKDAVIKLPKIGDSVRGQVISLSKGAVRIVIDGMMVGVIRGRELLGHSHEYSELKIGDEIEASVVDRENERGELELSFLSMGSTQVWDRMKKYMDDNSLINIKITEVNKGGLMASSEGLLGFMPVSQLTPEHYPRIPGGDKSKIIEHLKQFVGQEMKAKVMTVDQKEGKLIFSEKSVWEEEQKNVLDSFKIGDVVEGTVSALTTFGVFVKFGNGLEGLVHISEIVWQRIEHPKEVLKIGDVVKAQVIDLNKSKIYLSIKRLINDPWKAVKDKYTLGQIVKGEIHKVEAFGLMVKLDDDIHGLAHVSEISDANLATLEQIQAKFKIGDVANFEIVSIEPKEHRLGLRLEGVKGRAKKKATTSKKEETKNEEIEVKE
jgi:ribosomal protein S1